MMKNRGNFQQVPKKTQDNQEGVEKLIEGHAQSHLIMDMEEDPVQNHDNNGEAVGDEVAVTPKAALIATAATNNEGIIDNKKEDYPVPRMV